MRAKLDSLLEKILVLLLSLMVASVLWQVFSRFLLSAPSTITDEITSFSLIWVGLLGPAYATGKNLHLAIDLIPKKTIAKNEKIFNAIVHLSVFLFAFCVMLIGGIRLCWLSFQFEQTSAALEIPLGYIYLIVPLSGLIICYYCINSLKKS